MPGCDTTSPARVRTRLPRTHPHLTRFLASFSRHGTPPLFFSRPLRRISFFSHGFIHQASAAFASSYWFTWWIRGNEVRIFHVPSSDRSISTLLSSSSIITGTRSSRCPGPATGVPGIGGLAQYGTFCLTGRGARWRTGRDTCFPWRGGAEGRHPILQGVLEGIAHRAQTRVEHGCEFPLGRAGHGIVHGLNDQPRKPPRAA